MANLSPFAVNTIIVGNCLKIMPTLPDGCIDLIITDPPWCISKEVTIHRSMNPKKYKYVGKDISLDFGEWDHFKDEKTYWAFIEPWMKEQARLLREGGHLVTFFDQNRTSMLIALARELGLLMRQHLYWLKTNPVPRARKVDFMIALEQAVWFTKPPRNKATFNYWLGQQRNYVESCIPGHISRADGERTHPTQKPTRVLGVWISYLSNPGDLVADFVCGSGSTLVAAARLKRNFFGCDICEEYVKSALRWLEKDKAQLSFI